MILDPGRPVFPPLFAGVATPVGVPPGDYAREMARADCDGGTVVHAITDGDLAAAIVFVPDIVLRDAVVMLPLCAVGLANALGALAPPEVAVTLDWDGGVRVNGASCGALAISGATDDADAVPDWLVVELAVRFLPLSDEPGRMPDRTALYAEGCGDVAPIALLEAWVRHSLVWLHRWTAEGARPLHGEWRRLAEPPEHGIEQGTCLGVDERFGLLLKTGDVTRTVPLTALLRTEG